MAERCGRAEQDSKFAGSQAAMEHFTSDQAWISVAMEGKAEQFQHQAYGVCVRESVLRQVSAVRRFAAHANVMGFHQSRCLTQCAIWASLA